jgi:hypothetical protein
LKDQLLASLNGFYPEKALDRIKKELIGAGTNTKKKNSKKNN